MEISEISFELIALVISEMISLWLIFKLWRSDDLLFFKLFLTAFALIPFAGPLITLWIGNFPSVKPRILQDRLKYQTDVYDRWRHVFEGKNPVLRFRAWRELMTRNRNEDP